MLDLCCYTGGFAIQAKKLGGAAEVIGVDLDEGPLALAKENANLNQVRVKFVQADAFAYMRDMLAGGRKFDVVVLDPPKLIRSRAELDEGTQEALRPQPPGDAPRRPRRHLLSCTCAGLLPPERVRAPGHERLPPGRPGNLPRHRRQLARHAPRQMQILAKTGAAADHPVATNCPEREYLSAVWMRLL